MKENKTIIDIGACKGDDSSFYLLKGFDVIAVEANPNLCEEMQIKYKESVDVGLLKIINRAIHHQSGCKLDFYINSFEEWSSLNIKSKATTENSFEKIQIQTISLDKIIEQVENELYYIKIDIEGGELDAITSLRQSQKLPKYLSFEVNYDINKVLDILTEIGYLDFKIVRQGEGYLQNTQTQQEGNVIDITFKNHHSGLFGLDLGNNDWFDKNYIIEYFDNLKNNGWDGWYDVHTRIQKPKML